MRGFIRAKDGWRGVGKWERNLDAAGIVEPRSRDEYTRQRDEAAAYKREIVLAAGLLLPSELVPHVVTAMAFMHRTDVILDSGPLDERKAAYKIWEQEVVSSLAAGESSEPSLRPLLGTVAAHPVLHARVLEYLTSADLELGFAGFATEADYQEYVDGYSLPGFMLVASLLGPSGDQSAYREACRGYITAIQLLDFVNDLAEDLADRGLTIPQETMTRYGVTRADLEQARDLPQVRALVTDLLDRVANGLAAGRTVVDQLPPAHRPLLRCMIRLDELTVSAARADIPALLRRPANCSKLGAALALGRGYREARRLRL